MLDILQIFKLEKKKKEVEKEIRMPEEIIKALQRLN